MKPLNCARVSEGSALVSELWITLMVVTVLQMGRHQMTREDMDFAMGLSGGSNCLAMGLLSITMESSPGIAR